MPAGQAEPVARAELTTFERVSVVGESHYQDALWAACGEKRGSQVSYECTAELVPEPENPHDSKAVMVCIDGNCVGYPSRADVRKYGPLVARMLKAGQPTICRAFIGGLVPGSDNPNLGVALDIPVQR